MAMVKEQRRRRGNRNDDVKGVAKKSTSLESTPLSSSSGVYKPHATLLVQFTEETPSWYECGRNTAGRDDTIYTLNSASLDSNKKKQPQQSQKQSDITNSNNNRNSRDIVTKYRQLADEIYSQEVSLARQGSSSGSISEKDEKWVENTMRRGTLKDRVAAMSVVVNMDCMHKLYALDMLMDLAGCGVGGSGNDGGGGGGQAPNSRVGQMASEALSDLFVNTLLPKDRKLISLDGRPLYLYEGSNDKTLSPRVLLLWRYEEMIKQRYSSYLSRYLGRAMAGEDEPSKKSALTTASSLLLQVPEGEEILLTMIVNKIGDPTRKIASAAGHQLRLILDEHPAMVSVVAREVQQLAHRPHLSPRALYSCVVFLNQLQLTKDPNDEHSSETDGTAVTRKSSTTSLPASLINTYFHLFEMTVKKEEVNSKKNKMSDKKKSNNNITKKDSASSSGTMKSRLLGALLTGVNRAHPYLPKKDAAMEQHIDSLYRISHTAPPSASTQALMLLFQLAVGQVESNTTTITTSDNKQDDSTVTTRKDRFYRALYSKLSDGEMFTGRQLTLFFNLLYKAMKYDTSPERISAFIKRLLHSVLHLSSSIICGSLFLLSEIVRCHPELRYVDTVAASSSGTVVTFDPTKREPRAAYSGSSKTASTKDLWELSLLAHHFHPSVTRFVASSEGDIAYQGDPLKDFALQPFLDKFAFRNPKSLDKLTKQLNRGVSVAERKSGLSGVSALLPMNDPSYLESKNVSEEDSFFHKFFVERARRDGIKGIVRGAGASSNKEDKDDSDLEDEALDAAEADELIDNFDGDTDSEEEAFVNQLAEKLMESSGNGKVNFDDEDPDMDDWSDNDEDEEDLIENADDDDDDDSVTPGIHDNEDSFMDDASSDDNDDGEAFDALGRGDDSDSGDDVDGEMQVEAGSDDEFDSEEKPVSNDVKKQGKRKKSTSIYADAEEYEKQLEEEMRNQSHHDNEDSDSTRSEEKVKSNRKKKPRKR